MTAVKYRSEDVGGLRIFYREAGGADAPALLLLHGFPSASHMFRDLIPLLADRLHIIAPDLPGFGQSDIPARSKFTYTFDDIAGVIDRFKEVVGLKRFAIYVFDRAHGFPPRCEASGPDHRHHLAERQCLRGGVERGLESHPRLLAKPVAS
jgi:alpha-beta hydrolase superfamily lysophospholipase